MIIGNFPILIPNVGVREGKRVLRHRKDGEKLWLLGILKVMTIQRVDDCGKP